MGTRKRVSERYPARLDASKAASTLQVLFKAARLLDEEALRRLAVKSGHTRLRRSHTALLPHIDLGGTRVTDLALRLGVTKQAVSQLLDGLEAEGIVARVDDPDDARARRVVFTDHGKAGLLDGLAILGELEVELARTIGGGAMEGLRRTLLSVLAAVESAPDAHRA
jgi:DNA-binding MarR family transcriptional regulator